MCLLEVGESVELSSRFCWWMPSRSVFALTIIFVTIFANTRCSPATKIDRPPIYDNVIQYMMNFGYLPQSDIESGNLRTEDQLKDAIRNLQAFGNIPVTGEVDDKTKELLRRPRCGLADKDLSSVENRRRRKRYTLNGQKWSRLNLTWSFRPNSAQNLDTGRVRSALYRALSVWSQNSGLSFNEINSENADILVFFEKGYHNDGFPFDGKGNILAHAFFPGSGRGGDAHFDQEESWNLDPYKKDDGLSLFEVAAHEFGHSLGLSHSSVSGSLMFPWYQGFKADFQLPDDDREAIQRLYGVKNVPRIDYKSRTPTRVPSTYPTSRTPSTQYPQLRPTEAPKPPVQKPVKPDTIPPRHGPNNEPEVPDTCDTDYDAISVIRRELFIFKSRYVWRIGTYGLYDGYPTLITRLWNTLPTNMTHVDAVYERFDSKIMFFLGRQVYLYDGTKLSYGYPKPLTSLGLPSTLTHIDAAMVWGHNSKTYFFSGTTYWRLDDENGRVEPDYPRDIKFVWKGVDYNIDAAFQWRDGVTYFFKGKGFWKFNDKKMRVTFIERNLSAPVWMGCPKSAQKLSLTDVSRLQDDRPVSDSWFIIGVAAAVVGLISVVVVTLIFRQKKTHSYSRAQRLGV